MKKSYTKKKPYVMVVLAAFLCTFMTALGTAVSQIIDLNTDVQIAVTTVFLMVSIAIGIVLMKKSGFSLADHGFRRSEEETSRKLWWYAPLVVMEVLPIIIYGFSPEIKVIQYIIIAFFTIAVGFNEEIYFRGLALKLLEEKGSKRAIIFSSVVFGMLHLVNALNDKDTLYLVLQMFFAFLVGFVLAEIVSITKSLWIVIIWHAAHDFIASTTSEALDAGALIILAIQVGILLVYAVYIWKTGIRHMNEDR